MSGCRRPMSSRFQRINPVFQLRSKDADCRELSAHLIKLARKSGQLNLSGRGLATVPDKVWMLDNLDEKEIRLLEVKLDADGDGGGSRWWEYEPLTLLDLSSNSITEISANIRNLLSLTTLHLQDNGLETLPDEVSDLVNLTRLNLSHNKLTLLPAGVLRLRELRTLNVSYNQLQAVDGGVCDLVMLDNLDLSHNCIASLPPGVGFLIRLTRLDLSHNKLEEVPPDLVNLRVLFQLNVSHNQVWALPPLGELRRLELLYLEHNLLTGVPDMVGCEALRELHLGHNCIREMKPEHLEGLAHLQVLNLRDNKLEELPSEVTSLRHVIRLDLTNNSLNSLPCALGLMPHLQSLQLEGNPLRTVRRDLIQCGTARVLRFLRQKVQTELDGQTAQDPAVGTALPACPDRATMAASRTLLLALQGLSDVPDDIFKEASASDVAVVDLSKNKLHQVPSGLRQLMGKLTDLNLGCNLLTTVPPTLGACPNLQYLDLQRNSLSYLPVELGGLRRLRELVIAYNRFTELPSCVFEMASLELLNARDNQLTRIPVKGLVDLRCLAVLDLSNNSIDHVPPELGMMEHLRSLELSGNCFRHPRYAILQKGTAGILSYLRNCIPRDGQ